MNVLFIVGSARKDSISAKLCEAAASSMPDAKITFMRPHDMKIEHCVGCGRCASSGICVKEDDMRIIYDAVDSNDVIILATPVYFSGPSSIIKQAIDRFQCVWVRPKNGTKDKLVGLIAVGGARSPIFTNTVSIAKALAMTVDAEWAGELTVSDTDGTREVTDDMVRGACSFGSHIFSKYLERT
jgi:multimeric flavodoxin WrbA